jgi:hypothetical protein
MAPASDDRALNLSSPAVRDKGSRGPLARWLVGLLSGPVALLIAQIAGAFPAQTEAVYGQRVGPWVGWLLARSTGWFSFSLAEWLLAAAILFWILRWGRAVRADARLRALGRATLLNLRDLSVVLALFTLVFGIQYRRPPLTERMGWTEPIPADLLHTCAAASVDEVNGLYRELHQSDDLGRPTALERDFQSLDHALQDAWPDVVTEFRLGAAAGWNRGRTKGLLISPLLARLGLSGFYFPWTGEANRNREVPAMRQPHVAAHEMAHQRGIAREDEANFLGWAVARRSDSRLARYSAAMYAHRRFLIELLRRDPESARELIDARLPGVQRDVDDLHAYWARHRGRATQVSRSINDRYLRSHAIPDGTSSYGRSLELMLRYAAASDGALHHP